MYSDKENINILTSLLVAHGVHHAVVCPGSRNAPITHNLCECSDIDCVSVTDERSAAFIAMGMSQALAEPVVVCVTSGTALLNTIPAAAEAFYQHLPLIIISADRPAAMIGQLQGQTLPQTDALGHFVRKAVSLPEPHDNTEQWYCNRLVNEALIAARQHGGGPVHINVPITEPLFNFVIPSLSSERTVRLVPIKKSGGLLENIAWKFLTAERPMLVIGQLPYSVVNDYREELARLRSEVVVLQEQLSSDGTAPRHFDEALVLVGSNPVYRPDFLIYLGDTVVSKRLKRFLQSFTPERTVVVNESGELTDVTMHATDLVECSATDMIEALLKADGIRLEENNSAFNKLWNDVLDKFSVHCNNFQPEYSQMLVVKELHKIINNQQCHMQYANSTAVRLGQLYSTHYINVNRGVNGIEGSLSTAVGFASIVNKPTYCVIGDLSFFYDQNALWNNVPKNNLRILLLNNSGGGIFHQLHGLQESPYRDGYVSAAHHASAKGICEETHVNYHAVTSKEQLADGLAWLTENNNGPRLLEVFTDAETDAQEMRRYAEHKSS